MIFNKTKLAKIAKKYHLKQILLFGSQAAGKTAKTSDFDIGVLAENPLTAPQKDKLLIELSQKFEEFKLYAIKRYQDHQKFFNLQHRYLTKRYAQSKSD